MHRRLNVDRLPAQRVVVRFDLRGVPRHQLGRKTWWLVLNPPEVDLCLKDPGFEVDLTVDADLATLTRVWMGDMPLRDALRGGLIRPDGPPGARAGVSDVGRAQPLRRRRPAGRRVAGARSRTTAGRPRPTLI